MPAICRVTRLRTDVSVCRRQRRSHFSKQCPSEPQSIFSERHRGAGSTKPIIPLIRYERPQSHTSAPAALSGIFWVCSAKKGRAIHTIERQRNKVCEPKGVRATPSHKAHSPAAAGLFRPTYPLTPSGNSDQIVVGTGKRIARVETGIISGQIGP